MARRAILAAGLLALPLTACLTPSREYHGYVTDETRPADIKPGEDTRSTVLAQLGTPSTKSLFDDNTWIYMSELQQHIAFYKPKVKNRSIVAISFGTDDKVEELLQYSAEDGRVISYAKRETPTRGRELGLWEQIFGTVGNVALPQTDEATPDNPTGRRR
ncbi:MAG: outer membrane protein assembly factor BamE [Hyphomonas sp.]|nr:outer membrane protein assembly factor BamE [Hyphomonas sp.]MCB9960772.1 outer membrane protein assembly factor BamE [Hyphomonas sp.]MCB9971879.1 outer membrane protein assembly factor BamE [Hyphomonas sp.]